jgi:hypothetical protein
VLVTCLLDGMDESRLPDFAGALTKPDAISGFGVISRSETMPAEKNSREGPLCIHWTLVNNTVCDYLSSTSPESRARDRICARVCKKYGVSASSDII